MPTTSTRPGPGCLYRFCKNLADVALGGVLWFSKPILLALARITRGQVKRSLWAGTPIINMAVCARAERSLGIEADSLVYATYFITDEFSHDLSLWSRGPRWWSKGLLPLLVLWWACVRYQRFHFFCDRGLLPSRERGIEERELKLLKSLGKEIYLYAYGGDVRTRQRTESLGNHNCCTECPNPGTACICDDAKGDHLQTNLARYATAIFSMGDMIHYTPGSRNDLYYWPIDLDRENGRRYEPRFPDPQSTKPLRIVHAPNHRGFKGTHYLIEAVERLRAQGLALELVLVERVPNRQALEIYRSADVIFDQCLIGFHGYFALEALALGKPVMVFIRHPDLYLAAPAECPFVNTPADRIEANLRFLAGDRARLYELGIRGRRYIEKHHSLPAFAARLELVYRGNDQGTPEASKSKAARRAA